MGACEKGRSVKGLQDYALVVPLKKADITPVQLKQPAIAQTYNEDGSEKKPEPEKTFLQKCACVYFSKPETTPHFVTSDWMYLLPVVILMLTSSAAPPPQEEGQAAAK